MKVREGYHSEQVRNEAFKEVQDGLGLLQSQVLNIIRLYAPITNEGIAEHLGKHQHEVTPRVLELRQLDLVEFAGKTKAASGRKASLWKIKQAQTSINFN